MEIDKRIKKHISGKGSTMTTTAIEQGAVIEVGFLFPEINCEKQLMKSNFRVFCKFCNPELHEISCKETKMYSDMKNGVFHGKVLHAVRLN